jgi:MFS transporter, ACS family, tartrate transporter
MTKQNQVIAKCAWRLVPFIALLFLVSLVDRANVGFAALTMNKDLGFSPTVFGFGAGVFFIGFAIFQAPANLILERIGARRWVFCILAAWGFLSTANAMVRTPESFYVVRFLFGVAEAGLLPGMLLYLTFWFPQESMARLTANFLLAIPLSFVIGGPLSSLILRMDDVANLHGWQWLFVLEGLPAILLSFAVLKWLPDGPTDAVWLTVEERNALAEWHVAKNIDGRHDLWGVLRNPRVLAFGLANFFLQSSVYGITLWLPQILKAMGFANFAIGFVVAGPFVLGACAMVLGGHSSSKRGERIWHVALPWLLVASSFVVASVTQSNLIVLAALAFGLVGMYAAYGPFFSLPSSFLRGTAAASGIGVCSAFGVLGGFFGPTLVGALRQGSGHYATGMMAIALGFGLSALIVLALGRALTPRRTVVQPAI